MMKPILWVGASAAVVGALTFAMLTLLGVEVLSEGTAQESGAGGEIQSRDDSRVMVCVEAGGELAQRTGAEAIQGGFRDAVEETIAELTEHKYWRPTATPRMDFVDVDAGCPADANLDCPEDSLTFPIDCEPWRDGAVTQPSKYRLFVFVLSDVDLEKATLGATRRHGTQEVTCSGDVCDGVTGNVYISEAEAADPGELYRLLAEGLGLEKARDDDPDDRRGDDG